MFIPDHVVVYKTTNQHMRSNYSCVAEYSQIFAGSAWTMYHLCLLNSCMVFRSLNVTYHNLMMDNVDEVTDKRLQALKKIEKDKLRVAELTTKA